MDSSPRNPDKTPRKRICIIGAGAAGLAALKAFKNKVQFQSGYWDLVAFEARGDIGGIWLPAPPADNPPATPMYDSLTTNIAHPSMAFTAFSFPPSTPVFPPGSTVLEYLHAYASHFDLRQFIKLNTRVTHASWDATIDRWRVRTESHEGKTDLLFDLLIIANGHFNKPRYPDVAGLRTWIDAGKVSHSMWYRHAKNFGDTVLVAGAGPSGQDISTEMRTTCKLLIQSVPGGKTEDVPGSEGVSPLKVRGRITSFGDVDKGEVFFGDGTSESRIDYVILATGYDMDFPFLPEAVVRLGHPSLAPPFPVDLWNSTDHVFPLSRFMFPIQQHYPPHCIAFLGLVKKGSPMPMIEVQARAAVAAFSDPSLLDINREREDVLARQNALREELGDDLTAIGQQWTRFLKTEQFDYRRNLDTFIGHPSEVEDWEAEIFPHSLLLRAEWRKLEKTGKAEEWVRGVGDGGKHEWADCLRRLLKKAQGDEAIEKVSVDGPKIAQNPTA